MEFSSAFEGGSEQLASDELVTFLNVQNSVAQWHSLITVHHLSNSSHDYRHALMSCNSMWGYLKFRPFGGLIAKNVGKSALMR